MIRTALTTMRFVMAVALLTSLSLLTACDNGVPNQDEGNNNSVTGSGNKVTGNNNRVNGLNNTVSGDNNSF